MKVNGFDVLKEMGERNMDIQMAPLGNIIRAKATKSGTEITIGVPGNVCGAIVNGKYMGGLILADKEQFGAVKVELEQAAKAEGRS